MIDLIFACVLDVIFFLLGFPFWLFMDYTTRDLHFCYVQCTNLQHDTGNNDRARLDVTRTTRVTNGECGGSATRLDFSLI